MGSVDLRDSLSCACTAVAQRTTRLPLRCPAHNRTLPHHLVYTIIVVQTLLPVFANDKTPIVITARIVLPNTRKRKPTTDVSALFAKIREPQPVEL